MTTPQALSRQFAKARHDHDRRNGARVAFAGLPAPGLYQFNVETPELVDGEYAVIAAIGGVQSQAGVCLNVKR